MKFIEDICAGIVSPPKFRYSVYDLGSVILRHGRRHDFQVRNTNKNKVVGSYYEPNHKPKCQFCVLYLHSMNGSRLESVGYIESILQLGIAYCHFDFSGCGNSEGNSISFGANEKYDIEAVITHIKKEYSVARIILWGRSMGAVCAIKYCQMVAEKTWFSNNSVIGLILDSAFKSFAQLVIEIGHKQSNVPEFLIKAGYMVIRSTIEEKGNFKIQQLEIEQSINKFGIETLFLASQEDKVVNYKHSVDLFDCYHYSKKELYFINGSHNESRDSSYLNKISSFVKKVFVTAQMKPNKFGETKLEVFERWVRSNYSGRTKDDQQHQQDQQSNCFCSLMGTEPEKGKKSNMRNQHIRKRESL